MIPRSGKNCISSSPGFKAITKKTQKLGFLILNFILNFISNYISYFISLFVSCFTSVVLFLTSLFNSLFISLFNSLFTSFSTPVSTSFFTSKLFVWKNSAPAPGKPALALLLMPLLLALVLVLGLGFAGLTGEQEVQALEIGGELETGGSLSYLDGSFYTSLIGRGEFELYLPATAAVEPRLVAQAWLDSAGNADIGLKYLYLRRPFDQGHFTVGRQPVSWSYGAMLNLLDYGIGIDDLAGETITPGIDGLRYFHSLGGGRSFQAVVSFPALTVEADQLGLGSRLRLPAPGYDLSFNLSYKPQPVPWQPEIGSDHLFRGGLTFSGDLQDFGIYGSLGYFAFNEQDLDDVMLQLGLDYSWLIGEFDDQLVFFQAEYLRFLQQDFNFAQLAGIIGDHQQPGEGDNGLPALENGAGESPAEEPGNAGIMAGSDLFILNISTQLDPFSSLGLALLTESGEWVTAATPYYLNDLGGGLELRLDGSVLVDAEGEVHPGVSASLTYSF